jgi:hypothetical protein
MNFKYVFRWHLPFLFLVLFTCRAMAADTLLVLGDSLSAGYRMAANAAWPALLNDKWQTKTPVVNASISGDTSQQGWQACRRCLSSISRAGCWLSSAVTTGCAVSAAADRADAAHHY